MITTLASFASQFDPTLVQKGGELFNSGGVKSFTKDKFTWNIVMNDIKDYKVQVRVVDGDVTDVFCICRSGLCVHLVAAMFALKKHLKIKTETFEPEMLEDNPVYLVGPRINKLIYLSRQAADKDGELEKLGASVSLKKHDYISMRKMAGSGLSGYDNSPIFNGAKKLLGAAILSIEAGNYAPAFMVARAVITEISTLKMLSNSAYECCTAAAALMQELYTLPNTPPKLRADIFDWVIAAWENELYSDFHRELIPAVTMNLQKKEQQEKALEKLQQLTGEYRPIDAICDAEMRLLLLLGKPEEAKQVRYKNLNIYGKDLVNEAFARNDYEEVKRLARELTKGPFETDYWKWIHKIAVIENDTATLREFYTFMYFNHGFGSYYYDAIRATYTAEEWKQVYPGWIEIIEQIAAYRATHRSTFTYERDPKVNALAHIYTTEGEAGELALLLYKFSHYDIAAKAQRMLEPECPELLKKIFCAHFEMMAANSVTRDRTAELRREMKERCRTRWGRKYMMELRTHLLDLHPTWKVFREELSKRM